MKNTNKYNFKDTILPPRRDFAAYKIMFKVSKLIININPSHLSTALNPEKYYKLQQSFANYDKNKLKVRFKLHRQNFEHAQQWEKKIEHYTLEVQSLFFRFLDSFRSRINKQTKYFREKNFGKMTRLQQYGSRISFWDKA